MSRRDSSGENAADETGDGSVGRFEDGSAADSLAARLRERIRREGPLTFRDWMGAALYDERGGYYRRRGTRRWGRAGDYRTAPERGRLFAATFARHFARLYEELGSPPSLHLLEAGGGAGHFARGVLETLRRDEPQLFAAVRYVFDESSADSSARAAALLSEFAGRVEFKSIDDFGRPPGDAVVFANELLDALPVHRVRVREGELREEYVGADDSGAFVFVPAEPSTPLLAEHFRGMGVTLAEGQAAEVNLEAAGWVTRAARLVGRGFLVAVDYGDDADGLFNDPRRFEGTLRAFRGHEFAADVLADPGRQDLTTTVNWTHVAAAGEAAGLKTRALERLDAFLLRAGLLEQLERESARASGGAEVAALRLEAREMILPGGMASNFQVLVQKKG